MKYCTIPTCQDVLYGSHVLFLVWLMAQYMNNISSNTVLPVTHARDCVPEQTDWTDAADSFLFFLLLQVITSCEFMEANPFYQHSPVFQQHLFELA